VSYRCDRGLVLKEDVMNRLYGKAFLLLVSVIFLFSIGFPAGSAAQDSHTGKLIEGAKKEASLIWYTSTSIEDIKRLFDAFTKKYPFIKTEFFNAGSARVFNRILNEARAGKVFFDLVAVRGVETHQLVKGGFLQPYVSPEASAYPKDSRTTRDTG
jgi:ABC-type glycerol-3-phosphate transport system substrate-binding protein